MKRELKQKWAVNLESKKFRQGVHKLRQPTPKGDDVFCCLGVLCETAIEIGMPVSSRNTRNCGYAYGHQRSNADNTCTLTAELIDAFGIDLTTCNELMKMNDVESIQFKDIATWIRTNIPEDAE